MAGLPNTLHNNHNVYILGAGFSRLRGLPLMYDFMMKMRDALEYHSHLGHDRECSAIEAVLQFRLKASSAAYRVQIDLENIEELFSLASASPGQMEDSIKLAIAATLDFATQTKKPPVVNFRADRKVAQTSAEWAYSQSSYNPHEGNWTAPGYEFIIRAMLGNWANSKEVPENTFITFNYDTLVEETLDSLQVAYTLGFDGQGSAKAPLATSVFKLHGSLNWAIPKGSRTKIEVMKDYRSVVNNGLTPQIIPPTWKKDSRGAFDDIWRKSLSALSDATRVVVMGFSIPPTDLHFKYLLAAGLQENYSLREIVFVNPGQGMNLIEERCKSLFANQEHNAAKVRFVPSTAQDFVGQGMIADRIWSVSRAIPESIQNLQF